MSGLFSSLRVRLVLLVLIAALPAFALVLWTSLDARQTARENAQEKAAIYTESISAQEAGVVQGGRELLQKVAVVPEVTSGDLTACHSYFEQLMTAESRYSGLVLINTQGDIVCWDQDAAPAVNVADRAYFQRVMASGEFAVGGYVIARNATQAPVLPLAYPTFDDQGALSGMVATGVTLDWLKSYSASIDLPEDTTLTIIDAGGVVLARDPDPETWVGTSVADTSLGRTILEQHAGRTELPGLNGVDRLYSFAPLGDASEPNAYVAIGISTASAYAGITGTLLRNMGLLGGATLLALLAAWVIGDRLIVRDIASLQRAAQRVALGDLGARTERSYGRGELGALARAFNDMAQSLQERERARSRALTQAKESEERFLSLIEHTADAVLLVDPAGAIVLTNPAAEAMFGYPASQLTGMSVDDLLPAPLRAQHAGHRRSFWDLPTARPMGAEFNLRASRSDGGDFPVAIGLTPLASSSGRFVAANITDISKQKEAEEQLAQSIQDLARSNAELEQFAYVASHDLQEPLRMVGNYTQLLARRYKGQLDSDADEFINFAVDGARRMQELINDLLAFSRVGTRGKEPMPVSSEVVLGQTLANLKAAIDDSHATVTHDELPLILADETQVGQLLQNLIGNALKFHDEKPPQVHISARRAGDEWIFSVRDNGIGIAPEYHERIFVIFQRLHTRERYQGTGMGLAIAKKIVERHGGRIWVGSDDGNGTTFYFTLPAVDSVPAAAA